MLTDRVTLPLTLPVTGSGYPEIDALPEFLQDVSRELYTHSLAESSMMPVAF